MNRKHAGLAAAFVVVLLALGLLWYGQDDGPEGSSSNDAGATGPSAPPPRDPGSRPPPPAAGAGSSGPVAPVRLGEKGTRAFETPLVAGWGAGLGQLGRSVPEEGNPEAPMSLAIGPDGTAVVLDQVNERLVRFGKDGRALETIPVTQRAPQDIAIASDGTTAVLDRLADKSVAIIKDGQLVGDLPVEGKGIEEGGGVTGVFVDGEDVYVEREHGSLVKIGDTDGRVDSERPEIPGRPSRDGKSYLLASIVDPPAGRASVTAIDRATQQHRFTREVRAGVPLQFLVLLDSDLLGTIYLGAMLEPGQGAPELVRVWCLSSADGTPLGSADLPANGGPEETFRDLVVLDGGGILYAQRSETGVAYVRYECH